MNACAVPAGLGAVWQATNIPAGALAPPMSITFPLLGMNKGYALQRAAQQACIALKEWFHPTAGSESLPAAMAMTVLLLGITRRAHYSDIYLTIQNGDNNLDPVVPGLTARNIFKKVMRGQEHAWTLAFMQVSTPLSSTRILIR